MYNALSSLFIATCQFTNTSDEVFEDRVFDFESGLVEGWARWDDDGRHPEAVEYEAFCQRYSLEVRKKTHCRHRNHHSFPLHTCKLHCTTYLCDIHTCQCLTVYIQRYDT